VATVTGVQTCALPICDVTMVALSQDPSITAVIAYHALASRRLRLDVPSLAGNPELALAIEKSASRRPGVVRVSASARSGRVLIEVGRAAWRGRRASER